MTTTTTRKGEVLVAVDALVDFMNEANVAHHAANYPMLKPEVFFVDGGRKYIRIAVSPSGERGGASVHCFVDAETGDVYKSAGWKRPALNGARYNILDAGSLADLKSKWDPYTGYLYKR
jgi:hypothetical protein